MRDDVRVEGGGLAAFGCREGDRRGRGLGGARNAAAAVGNGVEFWS